MESSVNSSDSGPEQVAAICELCIAMGGRFNANNDCCQIRLLAGSPRHHREQVFARVTAEAGPLAAAAMERKVVAEYWRLTGVSIDARRAALAAIKNNLKGSHKHGWQ